MGATVFPVDNWQADDGTKYTGRRLRQVLGALLTGRTAARPLGARSGVLVGTPVETVTLAGSTVTVHPHAGVIDAATLGTAGPYFYAVDADTALTVPAADASQTRYDLVVVMIADPAEADGSSAPSVTVSYVPGTPGGAMPSTPAHSLALATVSVPKAGGGNPAVNFIAPATTAAGGVVPVPNAAAYPASPYVGQTVYRTDAPARLQSWDGSAWRGSGVIYGTAAGNTDASGYATVYHGLGFAPRGVFVTNNSPSFGSNPSMILGVDQITSVTFRVRMLPITLASGGNFYVSLPTTKTFTITFAAVE